MGKSTIPLFHGTSSKNIPSINRKGLQAKLYKPGQEGLFLSDRRDVAEYFAGIQADEVGGETVVCCVEADPKILSPDMVMYDMPSYESLANYDCDTGDMEKSDECWRRKLKTGEIPSPKDMKDWKTSLKIVNSVIAVKAIPLSQVKCPCNEVD